ncbi:MAG TPA: putative baseplate assembly protein [Candidatus Angelobacter sp.]|jgi:predicted phage baseplate assembly protein
MKKSCSCCEGTHAITPLILYNRPGLSALAYRIGTYSQFLETMRARLSGTDLLSSSGALPLRGLKTRDTSDPAVALLDAWAVVGDLFTFYQERIANEGYLGTATERRSVVELTNLLGYAPRPGVSATVYLAYTLDATAETTIPAGSRAQNTPAQGELPQSFETAQALDARGSFNNLQPRMTQPQLLSDQQQEVYLKGITTNLRPNDAAVLVASPPSLRRIAEVQSDFQNSWTRVGLQPQDTQTATKSTVAAQASKTTAVGVVDLVAPLSRKPSATPTDRSQLQLSAADEFKSTADTVPALIETFNPVLESTLYPALGAAPMASPPPSEFHALRVKAAPFGHNAPLQPVLDARGMIIGQQEWMLDSIGIQITIAPAAETAGGRLREFLGAFVPQPGSSIRITISRGEDSASGDVLVGGTAQIGPYQVKVSQPAGTTNQSELDIAVITLNRKFSVAWGQTPLLGEASTHGFVVYQLKVDAQPPITVLAGRTASRSSATGRTSISVLEQLTITDESAIPPNKDARKVIYLDSSYGQILPGSYVGLERGTLKIVAKAVSVRDVSAARYGMTGRVTQLTLDQEWWQQDDLMLTAARETTVYAQSEQISLSEAPVTDDVAGSTIELHDIYEGLKPGRWLIVSGERTDLPGNAGGITGAELVMLGGVDQGGKPTDGGAAFSVTDAGGNPRAGEMAHSFLRLASPLSYTYKRTSVTIYGNVVEATHGETKNETLGSGDATQTLQQFTLHQLPLTYVSAANATGIKSTLQVRVNNILWSEVESLNAAGENDRVYTTTADDQDNTTITFGDGKHGRRLPTGAENVKATYRVGIGQGGNVDAGRISLLATRPLGVKSVVNPIASSGGADRDEIDQVRRNSAQGLGALDRLVSVSDYQDFARAFAGVAKATASHLSDGKRQVVYVTMAAQGGERVDMNSGLLMNLQNALADLGDPNLAVRVDERELLLMVIKAGVKTLPAYNWADVQPAITAALLVQFGFDEQKLGEAVPLSLVTAAIQDVEGVDYVDIEGFESISENDVASADALNQKLASLRTPGVAASIGGLGERIDPKTGALLPAQIVYLSTHVPATLILTEIVP